MKPTVVNSIRKVEFSNNGITDSLTGGPSPKFFLDNLTREISKSKRKPQAISIITIKLLPAGVIAGRKSKSNIESEVTEFEKDLLAMSKTIKSNMRSSDFYSRLAENGFWLCIQGDMKDSEKTVLRMGSKISESRARPIGEKRIDFAIYEWSSAQDVNAMIKEIDLKYFV
jgi:GGDEF domain-containing protein